MSHEGRPVRVAVVGAAGWAGSRHVAAFAATGAHIVALVDPSPRGSEIARQYGAPVLATVNELHPSEVDLVVVSLPTAIQPRLCAQLLERGFKVLSEKPVAATPEAAEELGALPMTPRELGVCFMLRYHPAFAALQQWVEDVEVLAVSIRTVARKRAVDSWRAQAASGGVLLINGIHAVDLVSSLFPGEVRPVDTWSSSALYDSGIPEFVQAVYDVANGPRVRIEAYWSPWDNSEGLNDGDFDLSIDVVAREGRRLWRNWRLHAWERDGAESVRRFTPVDLFTLQAAHARSFACGGPPPVGFEDALRATAVVAALTQKRAVETQGVCCT